MPSTSFHCPQCRTMLKPAHPVPAGKQVRCPRCDTVFAAPETEYPQPDAHGPAQAAARGYEEDEYEDRFSERPRRRRKKQSQRGLLIGLGAGGGVLVLAALVFLLIWLLRSSDNQGTGDEDPLAFVPADSSVIVGVDMGAFMDHPTIGPLILGAMAQGQANFLRDAKKETGLEVRDLFDQWIVVIHGDLANIQQAAMMGGQPSMTVIIRSRLPFSQKKLSRSWGSVSRQSLNGKTYYKVHNTPPFATLYMPSDRIIIASALPAEQLAAVMASDGTRPLVNPDVAALAQQARKSHVWMVVPFNEALRGVMQQGIAGQGASSPELKPLVDALQKAKGVGFWASLVGEQIHLDLALSCDGETAARDAVDAAQKAWKKQTTGLGGMQAMVGMALLPGGAGKIVSEVIKSTQFSQRGSLAQASARVSFQTLRDLIQQGMQGMPGMPQPGFPRPQPGFRPPR